MSTMSFTKACKEYFGTKPGQKLTEFAAELKALTPEDKAEMAFGLSDVLGVTVEVSPKASD